MREHDTRQWSCTSECTRPGFPGGDYFLGNVSEKFAALLVRLIMWTTNAAMSTAPGPLDEFDEWHMRLTTVRPRAPAVE
jgi:hypothetical protein